MSKTDFNWNKWEAEAEKQADTLSGSPLKFEVDKPVSGTFRGVEVITKRPRPVKKGAKAAAETSGEPETSNVILLDLPDGTPVRYWSFGLLDHYLVKFEVENGDKIFVKKLDKTITKSGQMVWQCKFFVDKTK